MTILPVKYAYSENLPYKGWNAVDVSNEAAATQEDTDPALKAEDIVGRAVATIVESSDVTTMQLASPRNTIIIFLRGRAFVWSVSLISTRIS
jgi:hypothetical protein